MPFALVSERIQLGQSDPPCAELESECIEHVLYHAARGPFAMHIIPIHGFRHLNNIPEIWVPKNPMHLADQAARKLVFSKLARVIAGDFIKLADKAVVALWRVLVPAFTLMLAVADEIVVAWRWVGSRAQNIHAS